MAQGNLLLVARRIDHSLGEVEKEGVGSRFGLSDELLKELRETISELVPVLVDAEKKSQLDTGVREWLMDLTDVLYYADNWLDDKMIKLKCRDVFSSALKISKRRHQKLEPFWKEIKEIADLRSSFNLAADETNTDMDIDKKSVNYLSHLDFIRSNKKAEVIDSLLNNKKGIEGNLKVLSICGREGIGKTALAKDVLKDDEVKTSFKKIIWIPVSQMVDVHQILKEIHARATGSSSTTRSLIVLDDLRISVQWNDLINGLEINAKGSAVLVITQLESVASRVKDTIRLNDLDEEQLNILFEQIVCGREEGEYEREYHPYMRRIGDEIVKRCTGHPLVIMALASMLRSKSKEEWQSFYKNEFSRNKDSYDPFPFTSYYLETVEVEVLRLLKLCYDHLPSPLKHCFAYCSLFPKGFKIDVQTLIQMWMAQGFIIKESEEKCLEDVGYEYVQGLLRRYFFEVVEKDEAEKVTKCKLHTLMSDFAISVAGNHCRLLAKPIADSAATLHAWVDFDVFSTEDIAIFDAEKLRTIVMRRYRGTQASAIINKLTSRFQFLRALDMHASGLKVVPSSIGKLKLLKYLDLSKNGEITELPNSITELLSLQTLKLSMCFSLKTLPADISKLVDLRCLEVDGCNNLTALPIGICQLELLNIKEVLVSVESSELRQNLQNLVQKFTNKKLILTDLTQEQDVATYLEAVPSGIPSLFIEWKCQRPKFKVAQTPLNKKLPVHLEELSVNGFESDSMFCPQSYFPSTLVKLTLSRCKGFKNLPDVLQISRLKVLILDDLANLEHIFTDVSSLSPPIMLYSTLEVLRLTELPKLLRWWENQNGELPSFDKLSMLIIEDCLKFVSMPRFPNLQNILDLDRTSWELFDELTMKDTPEQTVPTLPTMLLRVSNIKDFEADKIKWSTFKNLSFLIFDCLPKLQTLPTKLGEVTSLQELHVCRCRIKEIPKWIDKLENLKALIIRICPHLEKLPDEIRSLRKIRTLEIQDCDTLLRRCEKDIGADWDKISHIPDKRLGRISMR